MSGIAAAGRLGEVGGPEARGEARRGAARPAAAMAARAAAFAALAGFAAEHWAALVSDPPLARVLAAVAVATAAGVGIALFRTPASDRWRATLARLGLAVVALEAGLALVGLPGRMLAPAGFGELADGLARGLTGVRTAQFPYSGPDQWVRLAILLAAPAVVALASVLAFWPRRRGRLGPRPSALLLLIGLYGVAVAQYDRGAPLARGALLLLLVAGWLFLPRLQRLDAPRAAATVLVGAILAVPLAARLPAAEPVLDYRSWSWVGDVTSFQWDHAYGPLDWPRRGETVLTIESDEPHYWRAVTLERFDGFRWVRSLSGATSLGVSEPPPPSRPGWEATADVTVGSLASDVIVSPGAVRSVDGVEPVIVTQDGSAKVPAALQQGESYTVRAYAPNPSVHAMRRAPDRVPIEVGASTLIQLPDPDAPNPEAEAGDGSAETTGPSISLPRPGERSGSSEAVRQVLASPYARTYRLARRLAAPASTTYEAVRRIEAFLRANYAYSEAPPARQYPLDAFLFEDRVGYCQQFAGAMALLLRMNGIPARVVAGFAPGSRTPGADEFIVRDVDAHSWVEVHLTGIGWVPFDATPPDAPAESQSDGSAASAARGDAGRPVGLGDILRSERGPAGLAVRGLEQGRGAAAPPVGATASAADGDAERQDGAPAALVLAAVAALALAVLVLSAIAVAVVRRGRGGGPDAAVDEVRRALERLGQHPRPGATLLELERRLERSGQRAAARYVRRLREQRYAPSCARPPDPRGRRALRRALTVGGGARGALRGYLALPPRRTLSRP